MLYWCVSVLQKLRRVLAFCGFHHHQSYDLGRRTEIIIPTLTWCDDDCKNTYEIASLERIYPHAKDIAAYVQPGAGHTLTLHRYATAGYEPSLNFLARKGLWRGRPWTEHWGSGDDYTRCISSGKIRVLINTILAFMRMAHGVFFVLSIHQISKAHCVIIDSSFILSTLHRDQKTCSWLEIFLSETLAKALMMPGIEILLGSGTVGRGYCCLAQVLPRKVMVFPISFTWYES